MRVGSAKSLSVGPSGPKKTCIQIDCLLIGTEPDDHLGAVRLSKESQLDVALRNVCLLDTIDNDRSQPSAKPRYEH